jgi:hypothetical protein
MSYGIPYSSQAGISPLRLFEQSVTHTSVWKQHSNDEWILDEYLLKAVFRIRIRIFLGLIDPHQDP